MRENSHGDFFVVDSYLSPCDFAEDNILCKSGGMFYYIIGLVKNVIILHMGVIELGT